MQLLVHFNTSEYSCGIMARFRKKRFTLFIFLTIVFLTLGLYVSSGFLHTERVSAKIIASAAELEKNVSKVQNFRPQRANVSTVAELCKLPEVRRLASKISSGRNYRLFNNSKVCYCVVPKAASTSLLRSLLMAEYPEKSATFKNMAGNLIHVQKELFKTKSNSSACADGGEMSFFVTRNPYERLFSAYIDKIFLEKFSSIAEYINTLSSSRDEVDNETKQHTKNKTRRCDVINVTFGDFLYYIVTDHKRLDPHFAPVTTSCNPCKHDFKFILKQEKLHEQYPVLNKYLNHGAKELHEDVPVGNYSGMDGLQRTASTFYNIKYPGLRKSHCNLTTDRQNAINKRLWDALKMLGNIDRHLEFDEAFFHKLSEVKSGNEKANVLIQNLKANGIQALHSDGREQQRREYLTQAYSNISADLITRFQQLYKLDFVLFKYDVNPPV